MSKPTSKSSSRRGRKTEGRTAKVVRMLPKAWAALDERLRGRSDTRGRVIERMLTSPDLRPEIQIEGQKYMQMQDADISRYYLCLADPLAQQGGEPESYVAAANARVQEAAEKIGLNVYNWDGYPIDDDLVEIEWQEQAVQKGRRYNTRQWEMWLMRCLSGFELSQNLKHKLT